MVNRYVSQVDVEALTAALRDAEAELVVTATASQRPDATTTRHDAAGAGADRTSARTPTTTTPHTTPEVNKAHDARAVARAKSK